MNRLWFQTDLFILLVTSCSDSIFELVTRTWWIRRWTTMPKWKLKSTRKHLRCWMNLGNDRDSDCRYVTKSISNTALFSRLIKIPKTNRHQVRSDALGRSGLVAVSLLFYDVNPLIGTRASDVLLVAWLLRRARWQRIIGGFILTFIYSFISFHWNFAAEFLFAKFLNPSRQPHLVLLARQKTFFRPTATHLILAPLDTPVQ